MHLLFGNNYCYNVISTCGLVSLIVVLVPMRNRINSRNVYEWLDFNFYASDFYLYFFSQVFNLPNLNSQSIGDSRSVTESIRKCPFIVRKRNETLDHNMVIQ